MNSIASGTVLITGPTGGLGRAATLAIAGRPASERPDLLLVGRPGRALTEVAKNARRAGATVHEIRCDLARLSDVRAAARTVRDLLDAGTVRPLRALVANAGLGVADTHSASADGYELTFAVNYLAHAQLIGDLLDAFVPPARVVLIGSNTYWQNIFRRIMRVPSARWADPIDLARPPAPDVPSTFERCGIAYSNSKLAILYYAHELQRRAPAGVNVTVFEPGFMPGTGLSRAHGAAVQRIGRIIERIPGVSSPSRSGPALASIVLDGRWAHLRSGAFVVKDQEREVKPFAQDPLREGRLWDATAELLKSARDQTASAPPANSSNRSSASSVSASIPRSGPGSAR
ncbi:short-chain dehydrogenase [Mycobacterium sp. 852002-50816_SCH5313054-b]|uniref:SDR family NAD(P)-dependent oxidoreductase n=1 Tax=Mycobacterium sp. 852002-50816_SCH5313054-b TaxID=1834092 RepID=UPI000800A319|nr:SDR family NAD(P)-dependent oxidoreductase [Mycobacterium sp. 852002-50816_SCH5313054-b]OBF55682.1 short-chain dehydrogenase [Mycobacterium sp. 852002-50816_SCH5313054-b]